MTIGIHRLEFTGGEDIGGGAVALHFRGAPSYTAGQHGLWHIPRGGLAAFTLASAPAEQRITLATNPGTHSRLKRALAALSPGDRVRLAAPLSRFTLDATGTDIVMLAQGIGITPFRSMLAQAALTGNNLRSTVIHVDAAATEGLGHPYQAETTAAAQEAFFPVGRERFAAHLRAVTAARPEAVYLVAGTRSFVSATSRALTALGIGRKQVRRDSFYGWSGQ